MRPLKTLLSTLLASSAVACGGDERPGDEPFGAAAFEELGTPTSPEAPDFDRCPDGWAAIDVDVEPELFDPQATPTQSDFVSNGTNARDDGPMVPSALLPRIDSASAGRALRCVPQFGPALTAPTEEDCAFAWTLVTVDPEDGLPYTGCLAPDLPGSCPPGSRPDLATASCLPLGPACNEVTPTEWASRASAIVVLAGSTGNGTFASPYGTITEAINAAPLGANILVSQGDYAENLVIDKPLTIEGACSGGVTITGSQNTATEDADVPDTILGTVHVVSGGRLRITNVTVTGDRTGLRVIDGDLIAQNVHVDRAMRTGAHSFGGSMTLDHVWITDTRDNGTSERGRGIQVGTGSTGALTNVTVDRARRQGVMIFEGSATASNLLVRNTAPVDIDQTQGHGAGVYESTFTVDRSLFDSNYEYGIFVEGGISNVTITNSEMANTNAGVAGFGLGLGVTTEGTASLDRTLIHQNRGGGIEVDSATLDISRSTIESNDEVDNGAAGRGINILSSRVTVRDSTFSRNTQVALFASDSSTLIMEDSVVQRTREGSNGASSQIRVQGRSTADLRRVSIVGGATEAGIAVTAAAQVTLDEVIIRDHLGAGGEPIRELGDGLALQDGAVVSATRLHVEGSGQSGIHVRGADVLARLSGVVVHDTRGIEETEQLGVGILVFEAALEADHVFVSENRAAGVLVEGAQSRLLLEDFAVHDSLPIPLDDTLGLGVIVDTATDVTLRRGVLERNRTAGLAVTREGAAIATDIVIRGTLPQVSDGAFGRGIEIEQGGALDVSSLLVEDNHGAGIAASGPNSLLTLSDAVVRGTRPRRDGFYGINILVFDRGGAKINRTHVEDSVLAGIFATTGGFLDLEDVRVSGVEPGYFVNEDFFQSQSYDDVGDCIMAVVRSEVALRNVVVEGCARGGVTFDDATGAVEQFRSARNPFGLVVQGFPVPDVDRSSVEVVDNDVPFAEQEDLPVPLESPGGFSGDESLGNLIGQGE